MYLSPNGMSPKIFLPYKQQEIQTSIKESFDKNKTKLSTNLGFEFINKKAIGLNQSHSNISY